MISDHLLSICQAEGEKGGDPVHTFGELSAKKIKPTHNRGKNNYRQLWAFT